ncbi:MAG: hypothetical protein GXP31_14180, partial [Kiritimatiellaeota bacterium]|nr:hypothetical protein [Kiritimatiellota bacterium]
APPPEAAPPPAAPRPVFPVTDHGVPVNSLARTLWKLEDDVGHSRLVTRTMNADVIGIENHLGAGPMALKSELPPVPLSQIAGWRFRLKLTPTARLNFHYSLGRMDKKGKFTPTRKCFYQITGTDFTQGEYTRTGKSALAPDRRFDPPGKGWRVETVWIPSRLRTGTAGDRNTYVRVEGFGNFQPSYFMAGLKGNFPGDSYAVRQFTPIFYGPPELALPPKGPQPARFVLRSANGGGILCETPSLAEIGKALLKASKPGLNSAWFQVRDASDNGFSHTLRWIQLPDTPEWGLNWDPERPGAVQLRSKAPYPDPRFARARVVLAGKPLPLERENREVARALVPRSPEFAKTKSPTLTFTVNLGADDKPVALAWADSPNNDPPALLGLTGASPLCLTWENRTYPPALAGPDPTRHIVRSFDPIQGAYLQVRNRALDQRLRTVFTLGFPLSRFPLMQFRYRASDMVHVTAAFRGGYYIRLGDDYSAAIAVREGKDLARDDVWHTWLGFVTDGFALQPFSTARFQPASVTLGSAGSPDQTGRYSTWNLDDFVFGPAVRSAEQLVFTPRYYDPDGVKTVSAAVIKGDQPFFERSPAERNAVKWSNHAVGQAIKPDLTGLSDGIHHVVLRAVDTRGDVSNVTDLPFLLDTKPLAPSVAVQPMANPAGNGVQLRIAFANGGGAPWQIGQAKFFVAGKQQKIPAWTNLFVHSATQDTLILNYPFLFRKQLDNAKDGDVFEFAVDNILDGAGNATPRVTAPLRVNYKTDKTGPAWYTLKFDKNVHWFFNWDGAYDHTAAFSVGRNNQRQIVHQPNESAYFRTATYYSTGDAYRSVSWQPAVHPWLSFRMRIPKYRSRTQLSVVLDTTQGTYTLSLKSPSKAKNELNRSRTIKWFGNKWVRLSFNVRNMLRAAGVSDANIRKLTVKTLYFRRRNSRHAELLDLDDVFLSSAAAGPGRDRLQWTAYDASGVAGLEAICYDGKDKELWRRQFSGRSADFSGLRKRAKPDTWLLCRARDKAGNLSVPFWMPFPNSD